MGSSPQQFILGSEVKWTLGLLFVASMASALPKRDAKAFSLFSVVTFPNEECTTIMTPAMFGICLTAEECTDSGGTASGNCASGFGVCCFRTVEATTATETVNVNNDLTHIQNEGYPAMVGNTAAPVTATNLIFRIAGDASICQIKLDFIAAVFTQPTGAGADGGTAGTCGGTTGDSLTVDVMGGLTGFSRLCGTLTGQHIYVDTARQNPGATLTIATGTNMFARSWKILVRRLRCDDPNLSPGCLQYHTGLSGRITSLNGGIANQVMLRNLNYEICIRPGAGMNGLTIGENTAQGATFDSFKLSPFATGLSLSGNDGQATPAANCQVEGIRIENNFLAAVNNAKLNPQPPIFCGEFLNPTSGLATAGNVFTLSALTGGNPFAIGVITNNAASGADTGFDLIYQQSG